MTNGLHALKGRGVPDGAISAMLILLFTLSIGPYIAGWSIGPYSFPELFSSVIFWPLATVTPLIWVFLFAQIIDDSRIRWRYLGQAVVIAEIIILPLAFLFAPITVVKEFSGHVELGKPSTEHILVLPTAQSVESKLTKLEPNNIGVRLYFCGAQDQDFGKEIQDDRNCASAQLGAGSPFVRYLPKGPASVKIFNFGSNGSAVDYTISVTYVRRRFF